ncbi:hypothetical protein RYX36_029701, partial [Vicia faba]
RSCRLSKDNPFGVKALRMALATSTLNWTQGKTAMENNNYLFEICHPDFHFITEIANENFDLRRSKDSKDHKAQKVGKFTIDQLLTAEKLPDLNCSTIESAIRIIAGTATNMRIDVDPPILEVKQKIKLECTLFRPYVEALDAFLQSGCNGNIVMVAQYLKVKLYNGKIMDYKYMYRIKFRVIDETDSATFVVFDHDCYLLTKKTCADLIDQMDRADEQTILPTVIGELIEQTMLFKIIVNNDMNSGFEQPFHVKKLCLDQDIVAKFKNVVQNSGGVEDDLAVDVIHNDIDVVVVQDLGNKFENIVVEEKYGDNGSASKLIEENIAASTLVKRGIYELADENDGASSRITKIIKIEKK